MAPKEIDDLVKHEQLPENAEPKVDPGPTGQVNPSFPSEADSAATSTPVVYVQQNVTFTTQENVVRTQDDGSRAIVVPETTTAPTNVVKKLTEKHIFHLKLFSAFSIFLFPPTGIIAFIYALKTEKEFIIGKRTGDLKEARKKAKITERLIFLSITICVAMYVLIFAIIERSKSTEDNNFHAHNMAHFGGNTP